jgi:hypothetical protein
MSSLDDDGDVDQSLATPNRVEMGCMIVPNTLSVPWSASVAHGEVLDIEKEPHFVSNK